MQILVVVANIQVRTLKAEVEKGFMRTAVGHELIDPKAQINLVNETMVFALRGVEYYFKVVSSAERESGLIFPNLTQDNFAVTQTNWETVCAALERVLFSF